MRKGILEQPKNTVTGEIVYIKMGCSDSQITDEDSCQLSGGVWEEDVRLTTLPYDLDLKLPHDNETIRYASVSDLIEINAAPETWDLQITEASVSFAGVNSEWINRAQLYEWQGRQVFIYKVIAPLHDTGFDESQLSLFLLYAGKTAKVDLKTTSKGVFPVKITLSNDLYRLEEPSGFKCNLQSHQRYYPGDTGMRFTRSVPKELKWMSD